MRIGIDCRKILDPEHGERAGVGHYVHHLVSEIVRLDAVNDYVLFFDEHAAPRARREFAGGGRRVTVRSLPFRSFKKFMPFVYGHMVISSVFDRERLDLLHSPANATPLFYRGASVVTVHDLAIYDHPEWFPGTLPGSTSFSTRIVVPRSLRAARRVIAVSQQTRKDAMRIFGLHSRKIEVIPEGVDTAEFAGGDPSLLAKFGTEPGRFFLFVGTIEPRKNIVAAVDAFVLAAEKKWIPDDARFIVAGADGWRSEKIFAAIGAAANATRGRVSYVGYVTHEEKRALMSNSAGFVFPSLFEGFGLPVLEAFAAGAPVISSDTPALSEVCGDAAILVSPRDSGAIAYAMKALVSDADRADRLRASGRDRAAHFSWTAAAEATVRCYGKALQA